MKNSHLSLNLQDHNTMTSRNSSQPLHRIHAFSGSKAKAKSNSRSPPQTCLPSTDDNLLHGSVLESRERAHAKDVSNESEVSAQREAGRERLKRHREEVAGRVLIPDNWGQEELLKDWIDCSAFEAFLVPSKIASARKALVADHGRSRPTSHQQLRIESRC